VRYAVLASVKKSNSLKDIAARCATWGLAIESMQDNVAASDYGVAAPAGDYRLIYAVGTARKAMRMPWKVPAPASWFNASRCLRAWAQNPQLSGVVRSRAMLHAGAPASTTFAQAQSDLSAMNASVGAADAYLAGGELANAVAAYQAAGNSGATTIGPEIDLAGAPNATQPFTQQAWTLNGQLAAIPAATPTAAQAAQAQVLAQQMVSLYSKAIQAGQAPGALTVASGGPETSSNAALYWTLGLGTAAGVGYGIYKLQARR
jgi:hypothetical protein